MQTAVYRGGQKDEYILSLKDMCGIKALDKLHDAGVYSLKIEGRMKQLEYACGVVKYYRSYIDSKSLLAMLIMTG